MSDSVNQIRLVGRFAGAEERRLPSGDVIVTFRVITDREVGKRGPSGRVTVDTHDCVAHRAAVRRRALGLGDGEWVEVAGAVRRRFWRGVGGAASRSEVEVLDLTRWRTA